VKFTKDTSVQNLVTIGSCVRPLSYVYKEAGQTDTMITKAL